MGSVVARTPNGTTAASGLVELSLAIEIFEKSAVYSGRARVALVRFFFWESARVHA